MPDLFYLFSKWWKQFFLITGISLAIVGAIVFMKPRQYLSVVTALPASPVLSDKSAVFNENIEGLYSPLGSADELDRMIGTAQLDTVYIAVTDQFNLFDHYKIEKNSTQARERAAKILKANARVFKSGYGELKIKVWDTDRFLAPQLANAIYEKLQGMYREILSSNNREALNQSKREVQRINAKLDSVSDDRVEGRMTLLQQRMRYENLVQEYQFMIDNQPIPLITVEKAIPGLRPDRPKRLKIMLITLIASLLFSLFMVLLFERKNTT